MLREIYETTRDIIACVLFTVALLLVAIAFGAAAHGASLDGNGNIVRAKSGAKAHVAPSAQRALQCVVDYLESHGVKIKFMGGYGKRSYKGSLHPRGKALDINQLRRDVTKPYVPRDLSNAAADHCGVVSGARWGYADNGHFNLVVTGQPQEPWPRTVGGEQ